MRTQKEAAELVERATRRWAEDGQGELAEMEENLLRHVRPDRVASEKLPRPQRGKQGEGVRTRAAPAHRTVSAAMSSPSPFGGEVRG